MRTFKEVYEEVLLGEREPATKSILFDFIQNNYHKVSRDLVAKAFLKEKYNRSSRLVFVENIINPPTTSICKKLLSKPEDFVLSSIVRYHNYRREAVDVMFVTDKTTKFSISLEVSFRVKAGTSFMGKTEYTHRKVLKVGFPATEGCSSEKTDTLPDLFNRYEKDLLALTLYELFKEKQLQEEKELEIAAKEEQSRRVKYKEELREELIGQYKEYE